jgi:integrase
MSTKGITVYPRGNVFYTEFILDGKTVKRSTGVPVTEGKRKARQEALKLRELELTKTNEMMLSVAIEKAYNEHWSKKKDPESPRQRLLIILEIIGDMPLGDITPAVISDLRNQLFDRGIKTSTVNRYMAALNTLLTLAVYEWEVIKSKPTIKRHKEPKGRIRYLSPEEENFLLNHATATGYRDYADMFAVLLDTGFRFTELNSMEWDDVNFQTKGLHCWRNKGDRPRTVPMTPRVERILRERYGREDRGDYPFNLSYDVAYGVFHGAKVALGLESDKDFTIHALRHTFASRLAQNGVDLYVIQTLMGHSTIAITERYAHLNTETLASAINVLADYQAGCNPL